MNGTDFSSALLLINMRQALCVSVTSSFCYGAKTPDMHLKEERLILAHRLVVSVHEQQPQGRSTMEEAQGKGTVLTSWHRK